MRTEGTKRTINIQPENYIRLFHVGGTKYNQFFLEIFQFWYKNLDNIVIVHDGWTNYIPKRVAERTKQEGYELFKNRVAFRRYVRNFKNYFERCREIPRIIRKNVLTLGDIRKLIVLLREFFSHYGKTEFFYTDLAFAKMAEIPARQRKILAANLKEIGRIKWRARSQLNKFFLEDKSYLSTAAQKLARQFGHAERDIVTASHREIEQLFKGKKLNPNVAKEREKLLFSAAVNGRNLELSRRDQQRLALAFQRYFQSSATELKGIPANPGIVQGRVAVLSPNIDNFERYLRDAKRIKEGSILVAETTGPEIAFVCKISKAIITNQGGLLSHAAIISRELGIPCIVGTGNATNILRTGYLVEVDANRGTVRILKRSQ